MVIGLYLGCQNTLLLSRVNVTISLLCEILKAIQIDKNCLVQRYVSGLVQHND